MEIILDVGGNCRVGSIDSVGHVGVYDGRIISWLCQLPIPSNGHDFSFHKVLTLVAVKLQDIFTLALGINA